jgi:hypothetical protein
MNLVAFPLRRIQLSEMEPSGVLQIRGGAAAATLVETTI